MKKPVLVVKFGSSSITTSDNEIDERVVLEIARQISLLQEKYNIVIVSSGAVAAGRRHLPNYTGTLSEKKAAAAIGNPLLIRTYGQYFKPFKIEIAQSLCERHHFANRDQFLQLKSTYEELWRNNVIPIANENDVVSNKELKFSDNDELATLIAVGFGAKQILFNTSIGGVLDKDDKIVKEIPLIDKNILSLARNDSTSVGLGGMTSKLNFARLATRLGIEVIIFNMEEENSLLKAVDKKVGTVCLAQKKSIKSRQKWLASGSLISGLVKVDNGAKEALMQRKSLLAVGVDEVVNDFESGEVFHIADASGAVFAVAKSKVDFNKDFGQRKLKNIEVANADDIVLL